MSWKHIWGPKLTFLRIEDLSVRYGPITALKNLNAAMAEGSITCILGANGAGKSSTLKCLAGLYRASSGKIFLDEEDVTHRRADEMVARGVTLAPEGRRLFPDLTVYENLRLGAYIHRQNKAMFADDLARVFSYFPRLEERKSQLAGTLSGGEQQMCAIGRALMSRPKILLMDEPSLGLAPRITAEVAKIIRNINGTGITIVLVEQNANLALRLSDYAYVLETGRLVAEGKSETLLMNDHVKQAYLGGAAN